MPGEQAAVVAVDDTHCLNCGAPIGGKFCAECGQPTRLPAVTLLGFLVYSLRTALKVDGKTLATLRALFTRPGFLTREYWQGRRMTYTEPRRLYFFASIVFFTVYTYAPARSAVDVRINAPHVKVADDASWIARRGAAIASLSPEELISRTHLVFQTQMPKISFVLLPFFALLLQLVFRGARRPYLEHITFSFHVHSFAFLAMAPAFWWRPAKLVGFAIVGIYVFLSMWKAYRFGFFSTVLRYLVINAIYSTVVVVSIAALILWKV